MSKAFDAIICCKLLFHFVYIEKDDKYIVITKMLYSFLKIRSSTGKYIKIVLQHHAQSTSMFSHGAGIEVPST